MHIFVNLNQQLVKKLIKILVLSLLAFVAMSNFWIVFSTSDRLISNTRQLIGAEVGLVLGTSKSLSSGEANPFFDGRVEAAATLMRSGRVEKLILSGSKDSIYYNEAQDMMDALVDKGIKKSQLILDSEGDRTLYSLSRLKEVHGFDQCIIVTQKYHAYRSIFLADYLGIEATCFVAESPNFGEHAKSILREVFARTKAIIDVYLLES